MELDALSRVRAATRTFTQILFASVVPAVYQTGRNYLFLHAWLLDPRCTILLLVQGSSIKQSILRKTGAPF